MVCISFHESVKSLSSNLMRMEIFDIILSIGIILKCSICPENSVKGFNVKYTLLLSPKVTAV